MTKELKKRLKEFEKSVHNTMRKISKEYGYKIISNSLYKISGDFFLHGVFFTRIDQDKLKVFIRMYAKLYKSDDIFWTIFDMKENISQKESLRANGAFVAPSIQFSETWFEISNLEACENICRLAIEKFIEEEKRFLESINGDVSQLRAYISEHQGMMNEMLIKMLVAIQLGDYQTALKMAKDELEIGKRGCFQNNGKDIYEYTVDYCLKKHK